MSLTIPAATDQSQVWLRVGTLIHGDSARPIHDAHIVYNRREILFVGDASQLPPAGLLNESQHQPDLDLPDFTLLPGFIEAHAHLFLEGGELDLEKRSAYLRQSPAALLQAARSRLEKLLRFGVIAVRDAGDKDGVGLALSRLYSGTDRPLMPYLDSPGAAIHHRGRYGSFMAGPIEDFKSLHHCVQARVQSGADRIKLIPTGIINFKQGAVTAEPQMSVEEISELVAAAKSFGKQTFAHASGDTGIECAIGGGVDSVEHGFFVRDDQLAKMRDRQIAWVPTFAPVQEQLDHAETLGRDQKVVSNLERILERHATSLVKAQQLGVRIIAGSDAGSCGVAHGDGFLRELELMEHAGLPSIAVIHAATGAGADRLRFKENFGRIRPGYLARFILARHSPLESIGNLRRERHIVFDGDVFEAGEDLDAAGL